VDFVVGRIEQDERLAVGVESEQASRRLGADEQMAVVLDRQRDACVVFVW